MTTSGVFRATWRTHLAVLLGYALLAVLFTWPLVPHFSTALPGEGTDSWQYLWNFWWFDQALFHGHSLYFTQAQYYPLGTSLLFHTLSPLNSLLGLPARFLGGYVAAYNWIVLLSAVLSGYGTFLLTREVLGERASARLAADAAEDAPLADSAAPERWPSRIVGRMARALRAEGTGVSFASFLAGCIFMLSPYRSVHLLGHLSLVSTETLPFFALFALQSLRRPGWKPALGLGLSWLAALLIDWYYPLYMLLLAGFFLAWGLGETLLRRRAWRSLLKAAATMASGLLAAAVALSPLLIPTLRESRRAAYLEEPLEFSTAYGADLAAFFLPSPLHPLWGRAFAPLTDPLAEGNTAEGIVYIGFVALALAGLGLWRERRAGALWGAAAGLFALLSLGPYLKVLHHNTGIPLPYLLLARLPIVRFTRVPARYEVLVQLAVAVLAGLGAAALLAGRSRAGYRRPLPANVSMLRQVMVALFLVGLIIVEYLPIPYPITPAQVSPFYQRLAQDPDPYALLEVPLQKPTSQWYYTHWMLDQTVHGKSSFRGYISRGDPLFPFAGAPLFRQLYFLGPAGDITYDDWQPLAWSVLYHYRVGYIVLEKERLQEQGTFQQAQSLVQEALGRPDPEYQDESLEVYRGPYLWMYTEFPPQQPFLRLGQGWHEVEEQSWGPFRWMERDWAEVYVILPQEQEVVLTFQAVAFLRPRRLEAYFSGALVDACDVGTALQECRLRLALPAGESRLEFHTEGYDVPAQVGMGPDPRPLSIGASRMRIQK